jgi:acetyl/propionyl-CoA carboxylase alpha subunit
MSDDRDQPRAASLGGTAALQLEIDGRPRRLEISAASEDARLRATLDGAPVEVDAHMVQPGILSLIIHGQSYRCVLDEGPVETAVQLSGNRYLLTIDDPRSLSASRRRASGAGGLQVIKAPMPGRIIRLLVAPGDAVVAHQPVLVIEAMKMQNELKATRPGKVVELRTEVGATVTAGESLLLIE